MKPAISQISLLVLVGIFSACKKTDSIPVVDHLTVNTVLSWKEPASKYLGKDIATLLKGLGKPNDEEDVLDSTAYLEYKIGVSSRTYQYLYYKETKKIGAVFVYPNSNESLDVEKVLLEAPLFQFKSGKYTYSTMKYFSAKDKDGNSFQFTIDNSSLTFHRVMFERTVP